MGRFAIAGFLTVSAAILLLAWASGDLGSLPSIADWAPRLVHQEVAAPRAVPVDTADILAARRELAEIQGQVGQAKAELALVTAERVHAQQDLEALRRQREAEQAAVTRLQGQQRIAAPDPVLVPAAPVGPPQGASAKPQLMAAYQTLMAGREAEARQMLTAAQHQMAFRPIGADNPEPEGTNWPATWASRALRSLDAGDTAKALREIEQAIGSS